jgi:hypothetical protein
MNGKYRTVSNTKLRISDMSVNINIFSFHSFTGYSITNTTLDCRLVVVMV